MGARLDTTPSRRQYNSAFPAIPRSVAGIARDANTAETLLYRHEAHPCELCSDLFGSDPVSYYRTQMAILNSARERSAESHVRVTAAAIQAELANTKAANQRLRQQIRALERRLGGFLGVEADNKMTPCRHSQPQRRRARRISPGCAQQPKTFRP